MDQDLDAIVRTVYGEAGAEPADGQRAVASVILNRMKATGRAASDIVHAPGQFQAWSDPRTATKVASLSPSSPAYQRILAAVQPVVNGSVADPTKGAVHFYNPANVKTPPAWDTGGTMIGNHKFVASTPAADHSDLLSALTQGATPSPTAPAQHQDILNALTSSGGTAKPPQTASQPGVLDKIGSAIAAEYHQKVDPTPRDIATGQGIAQGARNVGQTVVGGLQYIPGLRAPFQPAQDAMAGQSAAFQQNYAAQPGAGLGVAVGETAATAPALLAGGGLIGAGLKGVEAAAPEIAPALQFARGAYGGASRLLRGTSAVTGNALAGAGFGAGAAGLTGNDIPSGAETGAVAGVAIPAAFTAGLKVAKGAAAMAPSVIDAMGMRNAVNYLDKVATGGPTALNASEIVPGSAPTLSQATQNAGIARTEKALQQLNPNSPLLARAQEQQSARQAWFDKAAGTQGDVDKAVAAREVAAKAYRTQLFQNGTNPVDLQPVADKITSVLGSPGGNRPDVIRAMSDVSATMTRGGKLLTDPEDAYKSVRDEINNLINSKDLNKTYGKQAASQLLSVRDALDDQIDAARPGFKNYLQDYTKLSLPVTSMQYLQGLNLTDKNGNFMLSRVQKAVSDLDDQISASGIKAGKATSVAQREALLSIRDDLLRKSQAESLAAARGSDSVQNALDQGRLGWAHKLTPTGVGATVGAGAGWLLGHGSPFAAEIGGGIGGTIGGAVGRFLPDTNALLRAATQRHLETMLTNPSEYLRAKALAGASPGATQLFRSGIGPRLVPAVIPAQNSLLRREQVQ